MNWDLLLAFSIGVVLGGAIVGGWIIRVIDKFIKHNLGEQDG